MENQFNRYHVTPPYLFVRGQPVLAKDCRNGKEKGTPCYILCLAGNVINDIHMQPSIWVRYANQLRLSRLQGTKSNNTVITFKMLLDTFELPQSFQVKPNKQPETQEKSTMRRTNGKGKITTPLHVDPRETS